MKNILLIVVDCLGQVFLDGIKRAKYPFLNSLFSQGVSFSQCVSVSTTTSPSVASILTGTYPMRHGIKTLAGAKLHPRVKSIAERLAEHGYNTYAEVTGPLYEELGLGRGFLEYNHRRNNAYLDSEWGIGLCERIRRGQLCEPWFLFLHLWELHQPRWVTDLERKGRRASFESALRSLDSVLKETLGKCLDLDHTLLVLTGDHGERTEKSALDRLFRLGFIWAYEFLHRLGLPYHWKTQVNRRWRLGHGFHLAEELIRVPLVILDRERAPMGVEVKAQVSQVDIFPTLAGLLELPILPGDSDGEDLLEFSRRGSPIPQRPAYLQASGLVLPDPTQWLEGIRWKGYKYIRHSAGEASKAEWLYEVDDGFDEKPVKDKSLKAVMREELERFSKSKQMDLEDVTMSHEEAEFIAKRLKDLGYM